ncbi:MAG: hypothetical protein Q4C96_06610 [Planctomycetia bacterium]|nr:hypothetical protein [Planctomycetia bacterium]
MESEYKFPFCAALKFQYFCEAKNTGEEEFYKASGIKADIFSEAKMP